MVTDRQTDQRTTDRPTDIATYRAAIAAKNHAVVNLFYTLLEKIPPTIGITGIQNALLTQNLLLPVWEPWCKML